MNYISSLAIMRINGNLQIYLSYTQELTDGAREEGGRAQLRATLLSRFPCYFTFKLGKVAW